MRKQNKMNRTTKHY